MSILLNKELPSSELSPLSPVGRGPDDGNGDGSAGACFADPEVAAVSEKRRYFSASYKLKILSEADFCKQVGDLGKLLRREGLYSSHLSTWRRQRKEGILSGLNSKRGKKSQDSSAIIQKHKKLEKENERLKARLAKAEIIIEFQKKASQILEMLNKEERKS